MLGKAGKSIACIPDGGLLSDRDVLRQFLLFERTFGRELHAQVVRQNHQLSETEWALQVELRSWRISEV